jgi:hypothetical protein
MFNFGVWSMCRPAILSSDSFLPITFGKIQRSIHPNLRKKVKLRKIGIFIKLQQEFLIIFRVFNLIFSEVTAASKISDQLCHIRNEIEGMSERLAEEVPSELEDVDTDFDDESNR